MFWGYYFYWNGVDGARNVGKTDKLTPWQAAKIFAEDFWKSEKDDFLPTIALGVEYVEENLKRATEIALQQLHDAPTDGGVH